MREYTCARYVIATATCVVAEKTAAAATAQWESLLADGHVTAEDIDTTPRLALVDDARDPSSWPSTTLSEAVAWCGARDRALPHLPRPGRPAP